MRSPTAMARCGLLFLVFLLVGCDRADEAVVIEDLRLAPEYFRTPVLAFSGTPRFEWTGRYQWRSGTSGAGKVPGKDHLRYRYVVPILPDGWTRSEPVPLWVSYDSHRENVSAEREAIGRALAAGRIHGVNVDNPTREPGLLRGTSAWQEAVRDAESRFGISSHPTAPIVVWSPRS